MTMTRDVDRRKAFEQAVKEGIESVDRGEGVPHETVMAEMDALIDKLEREGRSGPRAKR